MRFSQGEDGRDGIRGGVEGACKSQYDKNNNRSRYEGKDAPDVWARHQVATEQGRVGGSVGASSVQSLASLASLAKACVRHGWVQAWLFQNSLGRGDMAI